MTAGDIPEQLVLRGTSDEDVPSILAQFLKRVELKVDVHVPFEVINGRAVRFLPLLSENVTLEIYCQLVMGTLEWWSENTLQNSRYVRSTLSPSHPRREVTGSKH